ncbi:MAG: NAD-dependent epimerase/dehydratase family protein [Candidatus Neomarinimicrobiota bacterium]
MTNNIVVTGGLGFLGQHLVRQLKQQYPESTITVLARSHRDLFIADLASAPNISIIYDINLLDINTIEPHFEQADTVFHTAAMISFWRKDRDQLFETNITGTQNIIDLCVKHVTSKLVYISSTAAMGYNNQKDSPADESLVFDWTKAKKFFYMLSKHQAELRVKAAAAQGLPVVIANLSTINGPGDTKIFPLVENLKAGKVPANLPGGFAIIDVRDAARGLIALLEKGANGENYLFTGGNYTYQQVMAALAGALGVPAPAKTLSMGLGKLLVPIISLQESISPRQPKLTNEIFAAGFKYRYYSTEKARARLGWEPAISLEQTFHDCVEFYNSSNANADGGLPTSIEASQGAGR